MKREVIVMLDNVRSAHNVGSVFRTSDGAGVHTIILSGYTPAPIDRFGRVQPEIAKTSLGATETVEWEAITEEDASAKLKELQKNGFHIVAVEQAAESVALSDFTPPSKVCYIFGNEVDGVRPALLDTADTIIEIPMHGTKESLNVSVTAGIVLFR